jgi:hypothetical protein
MSKHAINAGQGEEVAPLAVTGLTATDVGTNQPYNNGAASLTWTLPSNSDPATLYTITSTPTTTTQTSTTTSYTFTGLASNTSYTFAVVPSNPNGSGPSATSNSITATTVPQAPTIGTASNVGTNVAWGNAQANVTFTAGNTGGKAITGYTVTSSGSQTGTGTSSPINVAGMSGGVNYSFTVTATNANGTSNASGSTSVTPTTIPNAPSGVTATAQVLYDQISWSAPDNGGSAITSYNVISSANGSVSGVTSSPYNFTESAGSVDTYTVQAVNANGTSAQSSPSGSVTTQAPFFPPGFFSPPFFPPSFFAPPFFPPSFFAPPFFPPSFFHPPFFPPGFFSPPFFPPGFFSPPAFFTPPSFFHPPGFFSPPAFCIEQDTNVLTVDGYKKAKDITISDVLLTRVFDTLPISRGPEPVASWSAENLSNSHIIESKITSITIAPQKETYMVNKNQRFSVLEDLLVLRDNEYKIVCVANITTNDKLVTYNEKEEISLVDIFSIELIEEDTVVYDYVRSPHGLIISDGLLAYNAYPIK